MDAGRLRHLITIEESTDSKDSEGAVVHSWSTFASVYGAVEPFQGREFFNAQQMESEISVRVRIRYLSGVTSKMRINWNNQLYDIKTVINPKNKNREMQLLCTEGVNNG